MEIVESGDIPVVDFSIYSLSREDRPSDAELGQIVAEISDALKSYNAFFIKNHGLDQTLIEQIIEKGSKFFSLPQEQKDQFLMDSNLQLPVGYINELSKASENIGDGFGREAFYVSGENNPEFYPDNKVAPGFIEAMKQYSGQATQLYYRLMECTSMLLGLDREYLCDKYLVNTKNAVPGESYLGLRFQQYPPIANPPDESKFRLGVHADYSTLTLLYFTDKGLLSETPDGKWLSVNPHPGYILVQGGVVMQNLSKGRVRQNKHCVVTDKDALQRYRHSLVFFGSPDYHTYLTPIPELVEADGWGEMDKITDPRPFGDIWLDLVRTYLNKGSFDPKVALK